MNNTAIVLLALVAWDATTLFAQTPTAELDLALEPPVINTTPGPEYSDERRDYAMTIGIERTRNGRLWAAWVAGGDSDKGYFVVASSDDDGRTWSKPRLVIDPPETPSGLRRRILVGNFWTDPTGRLWLFFDQSLGYFDGRGGVWAITCDNPDAETPTWSAPRRIWHGATLNKPTVLKNGEWLLPISLWQRSRIGPANLRDAHRNLDDQRMAHVFVSTDEGKTWTRRGGVVFPKFDFDEHMIVERRDGSLWMLARTLAGIAESTSTDAGRTWSEPKIAMPHISARFHLRRLASGRLLLVRHGRTDERTAQRSHLSAFLSDDDGKTWRGGLVLDERTGVSYPDGFQAPDGMIYISYDRNRARDREILFAAFTEADILAGRPVSEKTRLQAMLSKATGPAFPTTTLLWKLEPGDAFRIESVEKQKQQVITAGKTIALEHTVTAILKIAVEKAATAGSLVQVKFESVKVESKDRSPGEDEALRLMNGAAFKVIISPQGQIAGIEDYDAFIKKLTQDRPASQKLLRSLLSEETLKSDLGSHFSFLPPTPVAKGDRWQRDGLIPLGPLGSFAAMHTYRYDGERDGGAAIDSSSSLTYRRTKNGGELFKVVKGDLQARKANGSFLFDVAKGRLLRADRRLELSGALTIDVAGNQVEMKLNLEQTNTVRLLP